MSEDERKQAIASRTARHLKTEALEFSRSCAVEAFVTLAAEKGDPVGAMAATLAGFVSYCMDKGKVMLRNADAAPTVRK